MGWGLAIAAGIAVAGTAIEMIGNKKASKAEQEQLRKDAELKQKAKRALLDRYYFNQKLLEEKGRKTKAAQKAAFAKGGIDISSGTSLQMMEQVNLDMQKEATAMKMELDYRIAMQNAGIAGDMFAIDQSKKGSRMERRGQAAQGGFRVASLFASRSGGSKDKTTDSGTGGPAPRQNSSMQDN